MEANVETGIISTAVVFVVLIIAGSLLYGCSLSEVRKAQMQKACIEAGGSWVAGLDGGQCLRLK